ncbi:MAG: hypothetical protein RL564_1485 [Pseudomonadota bacterium]
MHSIHHVGSSAVQSPTQGKPLGDSEKITSGTVYNVHGDSASPQHAASLQTRARSHGASKEKATAALAIHDLSPGTPIKIPSTASPASPTRSRSPDPNSPRHSEISNHRISSDQPKTTHASPSVPKPDSGGLSDTGGTIGAARQRSTPVTQNLLGANKVADINAKGRDWTAEIHAKALTENLRQADFSKSGAEKLFMRLNNTAIASASKFLEGSYKEQAESTANKALHAFNELIPPKNLSKKNADQASIAAYKQVLSSISSLQLSKNFAPLAKAVAKEIDEIGNQQLAAASADPAKQAEIKTNIAKIKLTIIQAFYLRTFSPNIAPAMSSSKEAKAFSDTMTRLDKNFDSKGIPDGKGGITFPAKPKLSDFAAIALRQINSADDGAKSCGLLNYFPEFKAFTERPDGNAMQALLSNPQIKEIISSFG